jgi:hypothetical protein
MSVDTRVLKEPAFVSSPEDSGSIFSETLVPTYESAWYYGPEDHHRTGPKAGMALVGHADANRHALLNTRLYQQTQKTLSLLVVVQGQCTMGCAADESGMEGGFSAP